MWLIAGVKMDKSHWYIWLRPIGASWTPLSYHGTTRRQAVEKTLPHLRRTKFSGLLAAMKAGEVPTVEKTGWYVVSGGRVSNHKPERQVA
jgi:hypothetical protein